MLCGKALGVLGVGVHVGGLAKFCHLCGDLLGTTVQLKTDITAIASPCRCGKTYRELAIALSWILESHQRSLGRALGSDVS
jgi:hypothetical protein